MAQIKYQNEIQTKLAGVTFDGRQGYLYAVRNAPVVYLVLRREKNNEHNANAVAVIAAFGKNRKELKHAHIGYLPKDLAAQMAPALDAGLKTRVRGFSIYGGGQGRNLGCAIRIAY